MTPPTRLRLALRAGDEEPAMATAARVRLTVEDVSLLDAPSTVVAETSVPTGRGDQAGGPAGQDERFALEAALQPRRRYTVRVHVDQQGNGLVQPGDLVGSAALPDDVEQRPVEVRLTRVAEDPSGPSAPTIPERQDDR